MTRIGSDQGWIGVNMRLEPHLLPPGYASLARNMRFSNGVPESRRGCGFPAWANKTTATGTAPWGTVHGLGMFSDPETRQTYQVVAADGKIYRCLPNNWPVEMTLPAGVTISGTVTFTQAAGRLICHRGFDADAIWTNGMDYAWTLIPDPDFTSGVARFPNVERSVYFQGRLWAWKDDDTIAYSDFNDPTASVPVQQELYINPGSSSRGVGMVKLGSNTLVLFKDREIYALYNVYGDMSAAYGDQVSSEFGCVAVETIVDVGNEVWFLSRDGLRALVEYQGNTTTGIQSIVRFKTAKNAEGQEFPVEVSEPIRPLIDRLVSTSLAGCSAAYANRKFYLSVPLDVDFVLGDELMANSVNGAAIAITSGATYQYVRGTETGLVVGAITYTESQRFVATATSATPQGIWPDRSTGSLRRVYLNTNPAILVYDFVNGAWSGYDTYTDMGFTRLITLPVRGVDRVMALEAHGYVAMLETDRYADQRAIVGLELTFSANPAAGETIQINGGTTVTTQLADTNDATHWGIQSGITISQSYALSNLFVDYLVEGGYYSGSHSAWTATGIWPQSVVEGGIVTAFRAWSTTGILPTITHNVTGLEVRYLTEQPIDTEFITGAKGSEGGGLLNGARARVDLQTWAANVTLTFLADGVGEEFDLATYTPDRTKYFYPANQADYVLTNASDDANDKGREDYSVQFGPDGTTSLDLGSGVRLDLHQQRRLTYSTSEPVEWRFGRLKITNTAGRVRILGASLDGTPAGEREGAT